MITWSEIEAEAGDYRDGFVAVFKKYEGQPTDEQDARGRPVVVSQKSFARHFGIAESTFHEWVKRPSIGRQPEQREKQAVARARSAIRNEPAAVAGAIAELPESERKEFIKNAASTLSNEEREDIAFEITSEASRERQQSYARQAKENQAAEKPFDLELVNHAAKAKKELQTLAQEISRHGLSPEAKEVISTEITAIREISVHIEAALHAPNMDEELAALLKAGS